jgi:polyhydroxybutyrate depolymerase
MTTSPHPRTRKPAVAVALLASAAALLLGACGTTRSSVSGVGPTTTPPHTLPTGSHAQSTIVDGTLRTYRTYVPSDLDRTKPVPLVVMIHGGFGSGSQAEKAYGWDASADAHGFVVVYPDGLNKAWNAGTCCGKPKTENLDDVGFITQVVATVRGQLPIDPRRIYVTGMSNGAMMSERLACETTLFAAAAPVAGAQMVPCDDPHPISVLHIHGLADSNVPMDGSPGDGRGKVPAHPPVTDTIAMWRTLDRCSPATSTTVGLVTRSSATCADGRAVDLVTVKGAGHQWPGSTKKNPRLAKLVGMDPPSTALNATNEIWAFFAAHPKPA